MRQAYFNTNEITVWSNSTNESGKVKNIVFVASEQGKYPNVIDAYSKKVYLIEQTLSVCRQYIGLEPRKQLSEQETLTEAQNMLKVCKMIIQHFGELTLADIENAFDLVMLGTIKPLVEHYGDFSVRYVLSVLNAYNIYRGQIVVNGRKALAEFEAKGNKPSPEEMKRNHFIFLNVMCERFHMYHKSNYEFDSAYLYTFRLYWPYISQTGLATLTPEQKAACLVDAKKALEIEIRRDIDKAKPKDRVNIRAVLNAVIEGTHTGNEQKRLEAFAAVYYTLAQVREWYTNKFDYVAAINDFEGYKNA